MKSDFLKYTTFHLQKVCCPDLKRKEKQDLWMLMVERNKKTSEGSLKTYKVMLINSTLGMEIDTS